MLNWVIDFSLRHRTLVILMAFGFAGLGLFSLGHLDIDAFPDTTPVQIQINTVAPRSRPKRPNAKSLSPWSRRSVVCQAWRSSVLSRSSASRKLSSLLQTARTSISPGR